MKSNVKQMRLYDLMTSAGLRTLKYADTDTAVQSAIYLMSKPSTKQNKAAN
jgi:hypothetical protein